MEIQWKIPKFDHQVDVEDFSIGNHLQTAELLRDSLLGENEHLCLDCHRNYKTSSSLNAHRNLRHVGNDSDFKCNVCYKDYGSSQSLRKHIRYKHQYLHRCTSCYRSYENDEALQLHKETCKKLETPCPHCLKIFYSSISLRNHIKYKHPTKVDNRCDICRKSFLSELNLRNHITTCHSRDATTCHECDKTFSTSFGLQSHNFYRHTEIKSKYMEEPHKIPEFSYDVKVENLSMDEELQTAELCSDSLRDNGFVCLDCHKVYKSRLSLNSHRNLKHKHNDFAYKCNVCEKVYGSVQSLRKHYQYKHQFQHRCNNCYKQSFVDAEALDLHKETCKSVETPCPHCFKMCKSAKSLRSHTKYKHPMEVDNWCFICQRSLKCLPERNLINHIATYHANAATPECDKLEDGYRFKICFGPPSPY